MEFEEVIYRRRSIRLFEDRAVGDEVIRKMIEHASKAPSGGNLQHWEFIVVKNKELIKKITRTTYTGNIKTSAPQEWINNAPVVIIVCYTPRSVLARYGEEGRFGGILAMGAAIENILLSAVNLGLGACWVSGFRAEELTSIFNLPRSVEPVSIIPIGYPKKIPESPPKLPLDEILTILE
ncbi:MAG: nitroreductase family protein [Nitrososphaeria archaeon]